jgi:hypothetical protein
MQAESKSYKEAHMRILSAILNAILWPFKWVLCKVLVLGVPRKPKHNQQKKPQQSVAKISQRRKRKTASNIR